MLVAISTDGEFVSQHFGRCPAFTLVDIIDGKAVKKDIVQNPGHSPGLIPKFLHDKNVDCIVCGGMGMRASGFFQQYGIEVITGVSGKIDEIIKQLEKGTLKGGPSLCKPGSGRGYGIEKNECDHPHEHD